MITKGAPESVIAACSEYEIDGNRKPLTAEDHERCEATYKNLSEQGYRVLAVAYRALPQQDSYRAADERELVLAGFVTFSDPPLEDAPALLKALKRDGVEVKILTGDNELVTRHVCSKVGLDASRLVLGEELDRISDSALAQVAEQTTVFARVSPAQKNRIIIALKNRGHVVGFLGDGINDAPSLHAADVGISVATAVDVAKDAAEIILLRAQPARASQRHRRRTQGVRQRDEVSADGHKLEFRKHVQHGRRVFVPPVLTNAADSNPVEQFSV